MRKFNFLIGAVSGLFGGLLLSNKKLRTKLRGAEDPAHAAKILGEEFKRSSKEIAAETKQWVRSKEVQGWWARMKRGMKKQCHTLQGEVIDIASDAAEKTKDAAKKTYKEAKKAVEDWSN